MAARQISQLERIAYTPEFMAAARTYSRIDDFRSAMAVLGIWAVIAAAAAAAILTRSAWVYAAAVIVIATRQQAMASLMHEASHRRLFSSSFANDFFANLFCALPIGLSTARYGEQHGRHHQAPNTDDDPYWVTFQANPRAWRWPKSKRDAAMLLLTDATALNTLSSGREIAAWTPFTNHFSRQAYPIPLPLVERLQMYVLYPAVALALYLTKGWLDFAVLWLLPLLTVMPLLVRIRAISEHAALPVENGNDATRHVDASILEKVAISSFNINYHLTHHLFPHVTFHNLPKMHALLMQNPEFRSLAHVSKTYLGRSGVLRGELTANATPAASAPG